MGELTPEEMAQQIVFDYVKGLGVNSLRWEQIRLVWFCKTLKNWKALVITTLEDNMFFEVTFNGEKNEAYLDVYDKMINKVISF